MTASSNTDTPGHRPSDPRRRLGDDGEQLAAVCYERAGYVVIARNWRCRNGELDLVLRRDDTIVICEVKTRRSRRFGHPGEAVTSTKQRRIRQLAAAWLAAHDEHAPMIRFDVAAVEHGTVEVIEDAF